MTSKKGFIGASIAVSATVILFFVWMTAKIGGERVTVAFGNIAQLLAATAAAVACVVAARRSVGRARRAWFLLAVAVGCWAVGQATWSYYEVILDRDSPLIGLDNIGFLSWGPFAVLAMLAFSATAEGIGSRLRTLIDGMIVAASVFFLSWTTVLGEAVKTSSGGTLERVVTLAFPSEDVVILAAVLFALARTRVRRAAMLPLTLIAAGVALITFAESAWTYMDLKGSYTTGGVADTGWLAGFLLIALAALLPDRSPVHDEARAEPGIFRASLPYLVAMATVLAASIEHLTSGSLEPVLLWNVLAIITLVLVRQVLALADRMALEKGLSHLALHDTLTGLANRALFYDRVRQAQAKMLRTGRPFTLAVLDLDDFKTVNDTLGHEAGDQLLVAVAERLQGCVRAHDTLARLGGDEFAIPMEETDDSRIPVEIGERALEAMRRPFVLRRNQTIQAVSIGVAVHTSPGEPIDALLHNADVAMYMAKAQGKGRVRVFEPEMLTSIR